MVSLAECMLPNVNRLKHRKDFSAVYRSGLRYSSKHLSLRALHLKPSTSKPSENLPTCIGISISLKVSKKAVVRNRIKRQLRSALRHMLPQLRLNWRLIFVVQPGSQMCHYSEFLQELKQLLIRAEVLVDGY